MGNQQSSQHSGDAYGLAMRHLCGVYGGAEGDYFGGDGAADPAQALRNYEASAAARAKEQIWKRIAMALKSVGVGPGPEGDPEAVTDAIVKALPNPRTNKKQFSEDPAVQAKICKAVAKSLNEQFTPGAKRAEDKFFDDSLEPRELCSALSDWISGLLKGINTEFLSVTASVRNAMRNLKVVNEVMDRNYRLITEHIKDSETKSAVAPFDEVYRSARAERDRQATTLENLYNVMLAPAGDLLKVALESESDLNATVKRIGLSPGKGGFAKTLSEVISGLGTVASVAQKVNKALTAAGLSAREYLDSPDYASFQRLLDQRLESKAVPAADLAAFLKSAETLRAAFDGRSEAGFREALESGKTGFEGGGLPSCGGGDYEYGGEYAGGAYDYEEVAGGALGGEAKRDTTIDTRVKTLRAEKKLIVANFVRQMARHNGEFAAAVKQLGPALGNSIPLSEVTDRLRDAIGRLAGISTDRLELSLIGFYAAAGGREKKESYLSKLRQVSEECAAAQAVDAYRAAGAPLTQLKAAIDGLIATVEFNADAYSKKFGGADGEAEGGADDFDMPEIARSGVSLDQGVREFTYFYYVARVRQNLKVTSAELADYGKDYVELLGQAVTARLQTLEIERKTRADLLDGVDAAARAGAWAAIFPAGPLGDAQLAAAKRQNEREYATKRLFWKVVQAMDLYMKAFTAGIASHPDDVRDIKKMLDGVKTIAPWFDENTGDAIWRAFECMGGIDPAGGGKDAAGGAGAVIRADAAAEHYYEKVGRLGANIKKVGIPFMGVPIAHNDATQDAAAAATAAVSATYDNFQALKNFMTTFARLGERFGGSELRAQVFMTPSQMYKALTDYLKASALSMYAPGPAGVPLQGGLADGVAVPAVAPYQLYFNMIGDSHGAQLRGNFAEEDHYFVLLMKAAAAKILTVLNVYEMFERETPIARLTPARVIIGGAEGDPEAIPEACELYFRMPRLVEFYRALRWDGEGDAYKIALIPELEGVFSDLIKLVFQKAVSPESGEYSEGELRDMIRALNAIYRHYHALAPGRVASAAAEGLVTEINRRLGIVKGEEMKKYWSLMRRERQELKEGRYNATSYSIIPGEDEPDIDRLAPSDRFVMPASSTALAAVPFEPLVALDPYVPGAPPATSRHGMLREFRSKIEAAFPTDGTAADITSFALRIRQAEAELKRAQTAEAKLLVAMELIQSGGLPSQDANAAFMFHETVVVGLNTLGGIYETLTNLHQRLKLMNPVHIESAIKDTLWRCSDPAALAALAAAPGGLGPVAAAGAVPQASFTRDRLVAQSRYSAAGAPLTNGERVLEDECAAYLLDRGGSMSQRGLRANAPTNDLYVFVVEELNDLRRNNAPGVLARPPNAPSSYTTSDVRALGVPEQRYMTGLSFAARMLTNYGVIMQDFLENLYSISENAGGLVEVRFVREAGVKVHINFSKLRSAAEQLMASVKLSIDQFRSRLPASYITRFEDPNVPGSVFWLEQKLVDGLFKPADDHAESQRNTLEGISRCASEVFGGLIRDTGVMIPDFLTGGTTAALANYVAGYLTGNAAARAAVTVNDRPETLHEKYGSVLSGMVFYDMSKDASGMPVARGALNADGFKLVKDLVRVARPRAGTVANAMLPDIVVGGVSAGAATRLKFYNWDNVAPPGRSLFLSFNQILARFLAACTEPGGNRIYVRLVEAFANSQAGRAVSDPGGSAFPDLVLAGGAFATGQFSDPQPTAMIFQSLAYILQRLVQDTNPNNQLSDHLVTTLADVPAYLRESLKTNLPGFVRLFTLLTEKGEFLRSVMKSEINCGRQRLDAMFWVAPPANNTREPAGGPNVFHGTAYATSIKPFGAGAALSSAEGQAMLVALIDSISAHAFSAASAASDVLKELGDQPVYFQTSDGAIESYKARNSGALPLMPLSYLTYFLRNVGGAQENPLYPRYTPGEPEHKLQHGVQGILAPASALSYDQIPGVRSMIETYNGSIGLREQIAPEGYLRFARTVVDVIRYLTTMRNFKSVLNTSTFTNGARVAGNCSLLGANRALCTDAANRTASRFVTAEIQAIVTASETSDRSEEIRRITEIFGGAGAAGRPSTRAEEQRMNLVDMGISPFNVHAFMRDIPLANLFNYAYTAEQMMAAQLGASSSIYTNPRDPNYRTDLNTKTSKELFIRLFVDPHIDLGAGVGSAALAAPFSRERHSRAVQLYGSDTVALGSAGYVSRIFRGDSELGMGRPKFLSDQLFNKALFGSVYLSQDDFDEAGPAAGAAIARGRAGAGASDLERALAEYQSAIEELKHSVTWMADAEARGMAHVRTSLTAIQGVALAAANASMPWPEIQGAGLAGHSPGQSIASIVYATRNTPLPLGVPPVIHAATKAVVCVEIVYAWLRACEQLNSVPGVQGGLLFTAQDLSTLQAAVGGAAGGFAANSPALALLDMLNGSNAREVLPDPRRDASTASIDAAINTRPRGMIRFNPGCIHGFAQLAGAVRYFIDNNGGKVGGWAPSYPQAIPLAMMNPPARLTALVTQLAKAYVVATVIGAVQVMATPATPILYGGSGFCSPELAMACLLGDPEYTLRVAQAADRAYQTTRFALRQIEAHVARPANMPARNALVSALTCICSVDAPVGTLSKGLLQARNLLVSIDMLKNSPGGDRAANAGEFWLPSPPAQIRPYVVEVCNVLGRRYCAQIYYPIDQAIRGWGVPLLLNIGGGEAQICIPGSLADPPGQPWAVVGLGRMPDVFTHDALKFRIGFETPPPAPGLFGVGGNAANYPAVGSYDSMRSILDRQGFGVVAAHSITGLALVASPNNSFPAFVDAERGRGGQGGVNVKRRALGLRASRLTYLGTPTPAGPDSAVSSVNVGTVEEKELLGAVGFARFNTTFVRHLMFITQTVRATRLALNRQLTQERNVILSSHAALAAGVTEYGADPFTPNEVLASRLPDGQERYAR